MALNHLAHESQLIADVTLTATEATATPPHSTAEPHRLILSALHDVTHMSPCEQAL